jgi:hypothetical protein
MRYKNIILVILLMSAFFMRFSGGEIANLSYFVLAGYALFGRVQLIQSLTLLWFFSFIGPDITPQASSASVLRYIVIVAAAVSLLLHKYIKRPFRRVSLLVFATLCLGVFIFIHSILFSLIIDVSILKTFSWLIVILVLMSAWEGLDNLERTRLEKQLFGGLAVLMLICLPLIFTNIGYIRNGYAFQGILDSSQSWGLVMAVLGSWLIGRLSEKVKYRWLDMILLGLSMVLLVMSATRTAGLALVLAASFSSIIYFITRVSILSFIRTIFAVSIISMITWISLSDQLTTFIFKKDSVTNAFKIGEASRGVLVFPMLTNIVENPMTGIGFGIASQPSKRVIHRKGVFGIPVGAPVEKGVTPLAILEELGVLGLIVVVLWVWMLIRRSYQSGFTPFLVLSTVLFTNLGEASLFSTGGMGLLFLVFLAWSVTGRAYTPSTSTVNKFHPKKLDCMLQNSTRDT